MNAYTPVYIPPSNIPPSPPPPPSTPAPLDPFAELFVYCVLIFAAWAVLDAIFHDPGDK